MPHYPVLQDGLNPFPASLDTDWMTFIQNEAKTRKLLKTKRRELYVNFLRNPTLSVVGTLLITNVKLAGNKYRALKEY